jgi:glycosyltransferase involved in cell wall biosynthesis
MPAGSSFRLVDISRLLSRLHRRTPTGIDRVEFAYARHYLKRSEGVRFIVTSPFNTGLLSERISRRLVDAANERWVGRADNTTGIARLREILDSPIPTGGVHQRIHVVQPAIAILERANHALLVSAYIQSAMNGLIDPGFAALPHDPFWYLHVSHINLHQPSRLRWMNNRKMRRMFMVHDLIPISHPEYFRADEERSHQRRLLAVANYADVVILNSNATKSAWQEFVAAHELQSPSAHVVPLGIEDVFRLDGPKMESRYPYFVVIGTIEARKNLPFLLEVWKQWTENGQVPKARLVVVGRRRSPGESALDLLDRSPALGGSVVEVTELADAPLAALLRGARALLAPSLIEGFDIPVAEALAAGVPVIASDIPAHREVGGKFVERIDALDGPGWMAAIDEYSRPHSSRREAMRLLTSKYQANSWGNHMNTLEGLLQQAP